MKKFGIIGSFLAFPLLVSAQVNSVQDAGAFIIGLINNVAVPVIFALAFIVFIWGVFQVFILGGTNEEAKEKGRALMLYGLIGFFVMVSVWGLVHILTGSVNLSNQVPNYPTAPVNVNH
tara:strand:- start:233126 stop:233482 length:357 start_codon:yes stop_codon:yes gene_type:complete